MPGQFIKEFINGGHGEAGLYSDAVEGFVVDPTPLVAVLLFTKSTDEENGHWLVSN